MTWAPTPNDEVTKKYQHCSLCFQNFESKVENVPIFPLAFGNIFRPCPGHTPSSLTIRMQHIQKVISATETVRFFALHGIDICRRYRVGYSALQVPYMVPEVGVFKVHGRSNHDQIIGICVDYVSLYHRIPPGIIPKDDLVNTFRSRGNA